jgi:pyruvate/2-oxoglutarate dehydrogenase complex dihydrolipoamide dehydrogenase (E3) component
MSSPPEVVPVDDHNKALVAHVHPGDWVNPTPSGRYNLVVIGAGTAGLVTAAGAAGLGAKVALVERHLVGGDCLNYGCVPSKALISAARRAATVRNSGAFGINADGLNVDFGAAMNRMRALRAGIARHDSAKRFASLGVDVFLGEASFTANHSVRVGSSELKFHTAVIATGARAAAPPIPGLHDVPYLTNETIFSLTELPKRLGVIGAGPIGCEMAQCFARLGSEVFLVEAMHGILPREEPDAASIVLEQMKREGVTLLCCGKDLSVAKVNDGIRLTVESHGSGYHLVVDALLVAVGRAPNVEGLNLEAVGVKYDAKGVKVDHRLRTANPRIYAAGDICSAFQFTHAADFMARIVIENALFFRRRRASALIIPWATFTSPEVARVGLSASEAGERGLEIDTFTQPFSEVDRAVLDGETEGFVRIHVRKGTDKIVGATIVAEHAGDMICELSLAMTYNLGLARIASAIHPYPTQTEAIRKVGDAYNRTRLTPRVKDFFTRLLAWRRR